MTARRITASEVRTYLRCREEHRLAYVDRWRSPARAPSTAAAIGTAVHAGLEAWWQVGAWRRSAALREAAQSAEQLGLDAYDQARVAVMLDRYDDYWAPTRDDYVVEGVEVVFAAPQGTWTLAGRYDGLVMSGKPAVALVLEHKTTSQSIEPGDPYWEGLHMDPQVLAYLQASGRSTVLYDVLRTPGIRPRREEPLEAWRGRLFEQYEQGTWFQRREIAPLSHERLRGERELEQIAQEILRVAPGEPQPRTASSCRRYGSRCAYWLHCAHGMRLEELGLVQLEDPHEELREKP